METIYEDKQKHIKITIDKNYDQSFLEFAESVLWGTDGILFKKNNLETEFKRYKDPLFVSLKENDELIGIRIINHKQIHQNNYTFDIFYRSLLAVRPEKMNNGYGTLILNKITEYIFAKFDSVILFALVEEENKRSRHALQKANYSHIATFMALSHVCLMPKLNKNITKLGKDDEAKMLSLLNRQYSNRSFVDINESFDAEFYYIFKENNEIKAGLQLKILSFSFINFPGFYGFLLMKIVPKIPILKKVFNPTNHKFLKIGNVFIADIKSFSKLLNSVLYLYNFNTSLAYLNPNSSVDSKIIAEMGKGVLSYITTKAYMFCKCKNISLNDIGVTSENCFSHF